MYTFSARARARGVMVGFPNPSTTLPVFRLSVSTAPRQLVGVLPSLDVALSYSVGYLALHLAERTTVNLLDDETPDELRNGLSIVPALANQLRSVLQRNAEEVRVHLDVLLIRHDLQTTFPQTVNT